MRQNLKTQIVTKLKNPNCEKLKKTLILTKLKKSNCDKTNKKTKLWQNSRTQTVTKLKKQILTKPERSNCNQTQKLKLCKTKKK